MECAVNKVDDVISVMIDKEIGLGLFTETWFSTLSNSTTAIIKNYGFDIIHSYREKRGAGVAIVWNTRIGKQIKISPISASFETFQFNFTADVSSSTIVDWRL